MGLSVACSALICALLSVGCGEPASEPTSEPSTATPPDAAPPDAAPPDAAPPDAAPPDPTSAFPWVYTPDPDAPPYAEARWETEDWALGAPESILYLQKLRNHYTSGPPEVVAHFAQQGAAIPPLASGDLTLSFAGDILSVGADWSTFAATAEPLTRADYRAANLETAVSRSAPVGQRGLPVRFNADPALFDSLPFDLLQLNNNHTLDEGDLGATETQGEAEGRGFKTTGLNRHHTAALPGARVAFLSYTWGLNERGVESAHELFVVPFGHLDAPIDLSRVGADIERARARAQGGGAGEGAADYVVLMLHWGYEFEHLPHPHFMQMARQLIALGADVIVGTGPHVVQPAELCAVNDPTLTPKVGACVIHTPDGRPRRAAVLYSLGNFTNDVPDRVEVEAGVIAKVSLSPPSAPLPGVSGLSWTPTILLRDPLRVAPLDACEEPRCRDESARLDAHLGAGWRLPAP